MQNDEQIQAFNQELDRLLGIPGGNTPPAYLDEADRETLLLAARLNAAVDPRQAKPRAGLRDGWVRGKSPRKSLGWRWAWAVPVILLALLLVFRQPVAASLGRLFGFLYEPGVGFVPIESARVLKQPVRQEVDGRWLTVTRGLADARQTMVWLEYSDAARPGDGAWLESANGLRLDVKYWEWQPDEPGTHGVWLVFGRLPGEEKQVTLGLPEGWRIPLTWVPASEGSQALPAVLPQGATVPAATGASDATLQPCGTAAAVTVCVQAVTRSADALEVLLEAQSTGVLLPGGFLGRELVVLAQTRLVDGQGNVYPAQDWLQVFPYTEERLGAALRFTGAQNAVGPLRLELAGIYAHSALSRELVVDLGTDPQPGQVIPLDLSVDVAGVPVHFSQAVLQEPASGSLVMQLASDPLQPREGVTVALLHPGKPERIVDRYGEFSDQAILGITVELLQPDGKVNGRLVLPLTGATLRADGPFNLSFDAPQEQIAGTQEPVVVTDGEFIPLPQGDALPMEGFSFSGRRLQAGDKLAVVGNAGQSTLLAASSNGAVEAVATLPGQVLEVFVHPDRGGIDYLTGSRDDQGGLSYEQLYTLRFGDDKPRLLVGVFPRGANGFTQSFDGNWLAYLSPRSGPGENGSRQVMLVSLQCRSGGECKARPVDAPADLDVYSIVWSPVELRLAALGVPPEQFSGMSDVFTILLDGQSGETRLTNLTASAQMDDQNVQWAGDGKSLLIACADSGLPANTYALCKNDLVVDMDTMIDTRLPWNMRVFLASTDGRWLVDRSPVMQDGVLRLRVYDRASGETRSLVEFPPAKQAYAQPVLSPDGKQVILVQPDGYSTQVVNLADGSGSVWLQETQPLLWTGWVR